MLRTCIASLFIIVNSVSIGQSPDPWWESSTVGLPQLIADGWEISFYSSSEGGRRREYILQHPTQNGVWHCFWRRIPVSDVVNGIRIDTGVRHSASCITVKAVN